MSIPRLAALASGATYLIWRLVFTHDGANPVLFFLLLAAEAFGFVRLALESSLYGEPRPPDRSPARGVAPDADVIVVVTDEPASEVRAAVLSARSISGSRNLRIVDRDGRPDVSELAERLGLVRIVGGDDADLGELIDRAMDDGSALFTLLVPGDVVVMPDVLEVSATAFADADVAVVACRVESTNAAHDVDFGGYGEHRRRDELMVPRLSDAGALPWWSGMAIVRRSAIREIGGMSGGRHGVTMATGVRLQAAGWRVVDVPVLVARRLAPWNDDRHLHGWARDLHERLSVLVDPELPRRNPHASRLGRRALRVADLHVGRSIQRPVLIGILFTVFFTSSLPLVADPLTFFALWGAWQGTSLWYRRRLQAPVGFQSWMSNDLRLMATDLAVAWRALPGRPLGADLVDRAPGARARRVMLTALQVGVAATLAVFGLGILRPAHGDLVTLASLAVATWLWVMTLQARSMLRLRQVRQNFRTFDELRVLASDRRMGVIGVSPFGLDVVSTAPLKVGQNVRITVELPRIDGSSLRFECPTAVRRVSKDGRHHVAYLRFAHLSDSEVDQITEYCAVVAGMAELRDPAAPATDASTGDAGTAPVENAAGDAPEVGVEPADGVADRA